jgi:UDP-N-acetylmuramate--alanine ligase
MPVTHQRIHFIGIGGYGMSGLALVFSAAGAVVSGSDVKESSRTKRLQEAGITVRIGHDPAHVQGADLVVRSTDVRDDNQELVAARQAGIPVWHRSELLAALINERPSLAVSGVHGKTTTTAMLALILAAAGLDPTVLVGGELPEWNGTARIGAGLYLVAEADESDGSFLRYHPQVAIVTNIEPEHLEYYAGDYQRLVAAFARFIRQVRPGGQAVLGGDDPQVRRIAAQAAVPVTFCGFQPGNHCRILPGADKQRFVVLRGETELAELALLVPGRHNAQNALLALTAAHLCGVPFQAGAEALASFRGVKRRFEVLHAGPVRVVDDYAHHPTEIRATLQAAREGATGRVIAVFQPHRYTRTKALLHEFAAAFADADQVVLAPIYAPPGEPQIPGISSQRLAELIRERSGNKVA